MDERVAVQPSGQSTARFLLEMIVLFAVLGSPYLMFDPGTAKLVMGALALGYLTPSFYRCLQQSRVESPIPWWRRVLVEVYTLSGGLAALLLIGAAGAGWILWAFPIVPLQTDPELSSLLTFVADIFSKMIIGSLVCCGIFLGSLALLYQRKQFVGNLPRLLRANGSRILHAPLGYLGFAMATLSLLLLAGNITASGRLYEVLTGDAEAAILELLVFFPILPFSLLAAAALLVVNKSAMFDMHPVSSIVWPFHGELHNDAGHVDGWARMVLVTAVACIAILAATVHPIHFGLVTAFSSVKGISPTTSTITLVEEWIGEQRDAGRSAAEIAAKLNEHGYWTPGSPETGLSKLFPNFETRADYEETACSVRIVADTADPARVQGITWIDAKQASLDLKYCVKVSCPSPVAWDALPSVVLYSSHASRNQYWQANYYVDILAEGTATGPGGYCSATGGLTDNFQG